jgi:hypothetical protein
LPSTVPRTFADFVLISPRMRACSPSVSVPVESIVPSTSPSMNSEFTNLTEPLIETPRERKAPDGVGMNVRLDGPGTTGGSGRFACGGSVPLRGEKRVKVCMARIVPNYLAFRKWNCNCGNPEQCRVCHCAPFLSLCHCCVERKSGRIQFWDSKNMDAWDSSLLLALMYLSGVLWHLEEATGERSTALWSLVWPVALWLDSRDKRRKTLVIRPAHKKKS